MCGILGVVNPRPLGISGEVGRAALSQLAHRGPDDEGWYESDQIMLGHRRLSIMDLSAAGHEPMSNEDGTIWITFNGEIYHFWELRTELQRLGHVFRSTTDPEVIIHGYEEWGRGVLERIDGMFAFGLWDDRSKTLLLARDRLGKKPLFVARRGTTLAFASQLRPLVSLGVAAPVIEPAALRQYLFLNYIIGPKTIFRDVEQLPAGGWMQCASDRTETGQYWDLAAVRAEQSGDVQRMFEKILLRATRDRMVSDAPVGIFLSGGIDSAVITALAQREGSRPQHTFSVGFEDRSYDERPKAARIAAHLGTEHHEIVCHPQDVPDLLPYLTLSADHMLADQSMIPLAKLAREAKRAVKVVLTGDGGDELLGGYVTYRALRIAALYTQFVPRPLRGLAASLADRLPVNPHKMATSMLLVRFLKATTDSLSRAHASWRTIWSHAEVDALLAGRSASFQEWNEYSSRFRSQCGWPLVKTAIYADITTWLVDSILAKVDRATMASGLEARSPLLDSRLVEFAFATLLAQPETCVSKLPLRRMGAALIGPELAAAKKEGFQTPFSAWFAGPLREYVRSQLDFLQEALPGTFAAAVLDRVEQEHAAHVRDHGLKLWSLVALAEWCRLYPGVRLADPA
ncbi:MAG: asparagine synthase (glutamine-hydrolyzing) [Candidatus Binatia bacterium]